MDERMRMITKSQWLSECQSFELDWHKTHPARWSDNWPIGWAKKFASWDLYPLSFRGGTIVDIGCGSRPPCNEYFGECAIVNVEPLADQYANIPQVAEFWADVEYMPVPAETTCETLRGVADFVLCHNVLDHCYDWHQVIRNAALYARAGALFILVTDCAAPHKGHPGVGKPDGVIDFCSQWFGVVDEKHNYGSPRRDLFLRMERREDGGEADGQ